jgi:hypothetical protein
MSDAQTLTIDLDSLDWDALEEIEEIVGHSIATELLDGKPSMRTIRALVLWSLRKSDPKMTLETMPDVRSLNVEMVQQTPQVPLAQRRPRARLPRSSSGTA